MLPVLGYARIRPWDGNGDGFNFGRPRKDRVLFALAILGAVLFLGMMAGAFSGLVQTEAVSNGASRFLNHVQISPATADQDTCSGTLGSAQATLNSGKLTVAQAKQLMIFNIWPDDHRDSSGRMLSRVDLSIGERPGVWTLWLAQVQKSWKVCSLSYDPQGQYVGDGGFY